MRRKLSKRNDRADFRCHWKGTELRKKWNLHRTTAVNKPADSKFAFKRELSNEAGFRGGYCNKKRGASLAQRRQRVSTSNKIASSGAMSRVLNHREQSVEYQKRALKLYGCMPSHS